jgi:fluoride exporter
MLKFIYLIVGGAVGTVLRYVLAGAMHNFLGASFPYGTLTVNLSGCFLIGIFASLAEKKFLLGADIRLLLMIGFCGAFTTFSTLIFETDNLIKNGEVLRAFMNVFLSVVLGFIIFRIGVVLGELI